MLKNLPKPTTFPEGQRAMFGLAMIAGGIACGLGAIILTGWFMFAAHWFPEQRLTIIQILGIDLGLSHAGTLMILVGLLIGGPVGRWGMTASKDGLSINAAGDGEPVEPAVIAPVPETPNG